MENSLSKNAFDLSQRAISEFKEIYQKEFGEEITDEEAQKMGSNLLRLYKLLLDSPPVKKVDTRIGVTMQEFKALKYLHQAIYHDGKSPSVRDVCAAVGLRSSSSGLRMIRKLMERGFVYRDSDDKLRLSEPVRGCDVNIWELAAPGKSGHLPPAGN